MVMPASCDGAATRVTVLSYQSFPLTRVTQTPGGNKSHARPRVTCDTRASITFSQLEVSQSARFDP